MDCPALYARRPLHRRHSRRLESIFLGEAANFSVVRSIRVLRPLRAVKSIPGMPILIKTIISMTTKLGNAAMLCCLLCLIFAIVGVQMFKGLHRLTSLTPHALLRCPNCTSAWPAGELHGRCALPGFDVVPGFEPSSGTSELSYLRTASAVAFNSLPATRSRDVRTWDWSAELGPPYPVQSDYDSGLACDLEDSSESVEMYSDVVLLTRHDSACPLGQVH